jgi:hypothetical protein
MAINARTIKLAKASGESLQVAESLVEAGIDTPKKVKDASDQELTAAVGESAQSRLRDKYPAA